MEQDGLEHRLFGKAAVVTLVAYSDAHAVGRAGLAVTAVCDAVNIRSTNGAWMILDMSQHPVEMIRRRECFRATATHTPVAQDQQREGYWRPDSEEN